MGLRGPAPKPTALRILHGEESRRINKTEPQPGPGLPEPPEDMEPAALAVWEYIVRELAVMGLAHRPDRYALRVYCDAVVAHARSSELARLGPVVKDRENRTIKTNPAFRAQQAAATTILRFGREFGLTPASRVQFGANDIAEDSLAERLLS